MDENLDYYEILEQMFADLSDHQIECAVYSTCVNRPMLKPLAKLDEMISILNGLTVLSQERTRPLNIKMSQFLDRYIYTKLLEYFPDASTDFLWDFCSNSDILPGDIYRLVNELAEAGWRFKDDNLSDTFDYLNSLLQIESMLQLSQGSNFNKDQYLKSFLEPPKVFLNPKRRSALSHRKVQHADINYALIFLYNRFKYLRMKDINRLFDSYKMHIVLTYLRLKRQPRAFRTPRKTVEFDLSLPVHTSVLKEVFYLKHEHMFRNTIPLGRDSD